MIYVNQQYGTCSHRRLSKSKLREEKCSTKLPAPTTRCSPSPFIRISGPDGRPSSLNGLAGKIIKGKFPSVSTQYSKNLREICP